MIGENKLKEAYINQILAIFNSEDQDFYDIAKQLKLYDDDQVGAEQEFNNLPLIEKLKKLKNKLIGIDSIKDLLSISLNFTKNTKNPNMEAEYLYNQPTEEVNGSGLLGLISGVFKFIFNPQHGGFLYSLIAMIDNFSVSLNPEVNLLSKEIKISEHGDLFVEAAKIDPRFNRIYRDLIGKNCTDQQILHEFFKLIKTTGVNLNNQQRHRLFVLAEKKILKNNVGLVASVDEVVKKVTTNLTNAYMILEVNATASMNLEVEKAKIETVALAVRALVTKIDEQEKILQQYMINKTEQPKSKEQKLEIYNYIQHNKQKLYHFLLKTEAWSNGETLSKKKPFDFAYIYNQFAKFPAANRQDSNFAERERDNGDAAKSIFKLFKKGEAVAGKLKNQEIFEQSIFTCNQELLNEITTMKAQREAEVNEFSEYLQLKECSFKKHLDSLETLYDQTIEYFKSNNPGISSNPEFNPIILKMGELNEKIAVVQNMKNSLGQEIKNLDADIDQLKKSILSSSGVANISSEQTKTLFEDYNSVYNSAKLKIEALKLKINRYQQHLGYNVLKNDFNTRVGPSTGITSPAGREGISPAGIWAPQPA